MNIASLRDSITRRLLVRAAKCDDVSRGSDDLVRKLIFRQRAYGYARVARAMFRLLDRFE